MYIRENPRNGQNEKHNMVAGIEFKAKWLTKGLEGGPRHDT